ncbi:hypothetical protein OPQ81_009194 [Rhizoctonia solani]|nr:hypothetical protein OPQ81_009194 [Rhizoctonia solani]
MQWHSCEGTPSGVVTASSSTPPISTPLMVSPTLPPQVAYPPLEPANWPRGTGSDVQAYEAQSVMWGSTSSIPGHHGVDSQEVPSTLPSSTNLIAPNALAYIVNHVYRSPITLPPFQGESPAPHHSTTYFEPRRWTPGEHDDQVSWG